MVTSATIPMTMLFIVTESVLSSYFYTEDLRDGMFVVKKGTVPPNVKWLARAYMVVADLKRTGWGYLEIETASGEKNTVQAYQAGFLEGTVCSDLIYNYWKRNIDDSPLRKQDYYTALMKFIQTNTDKLLNRATVHKYTAWLYTCLLHKQIEGVHDALKQTKPNANITYYDLILLHAWDELPELLAALQFREARFGLDFSTVIVKYTKRKNVSNVLVLHSKPYEDIVRFQKKYTLPFESVYSDLKDKVKATTITFTSPPGIVTAEDAFYLASTNIVVARTAIDTAYKAVITPTSVVHFGFVKAYVATRLANTTYQWFHEMSSFSGNTYNSEYVILDYDKIDIDMGSDSVLYAYDIPGPSRYLTYGIVFVKGKTILSVNVPKSVNVYHSTYQSRNVDRHGQLYSYSASPRVMKVRVYEDSIEDLDDLLHVGQFNMTTDLLTSGPLTPNFYPKTVVYTKLMNSKLHDLNNFVIYGYPDKEPIVTYGDGGSNATYIPEQAED